MQPIAAALSRITLGAPAQFRNMTVFPLFAPPAGVPGYAMDAIEEPRPEAKPPVEEAVRRFLDDMKSAALQRFPALAEGEDLRIESETVAGGALYAQNRMVHLCAFHVEKRAGRPIGRGGRIDFEIPAFLRRTARSA